MLAPSLDLEVDSWRKQYVRPPIVGAIIYIFCMVARQYLWYIMKKRRSLRLPSRHWLNDFLVLNFKHADRNNNQVAQSLRFTNNAPPTQCTHFVFAQKNVEIIRVSGDELMSSALTRLKVRQSTLWHLTVKHLSESLLITTDL